MRSTDAISSASPLTVAKALLTCRSWTVQLIALLALLDNASISARKCLMASAYSRNGTSPPSPSVTVSVAMSTTPVTPSGAAETHLEGHAGTVAGTRASDSWLPKSYNLMKKPSKSPTPQHLAGPVSGERAVFHGDSAVHHHVGDALRQLVRVPQGAVLPEAVRVEHH